MPDQWYKTYVGLPFIRYGRDRRGIDCWGLVRLVYRECLGIELLDLSDAYLGDNHTERKYGMDNTYHMESVRWQEIKSPRSMDVIAFQLYGLVNHVALVIDSARMLHIENAAGSCIESYREPYRFNRIKGFYRHVKN